MPEVEMATRTAVAKGVARRKREVTGKPFYGWEDSVRELDCVFEVYPRRVARDGRMGRTYGGYVVMRMAWI